MTEPSSQEILVYRGRQIESRHHVTFAVVDENGETRHRQGEIDRPVFPRSAVKPLQAIALVESGAAERFAVSDRELALASASHNGEDMHVEVVSAWLERLGLGVSDLECGAHPPAYAPSAQALASSGGSPSALHNNCSGKHAGMLTLARHMGVDHHGYVRPDHPVQRVISETVQAMTGLRTLPEPAIDGCSIPTFPTPLRDLAGGMARFAKPDGLTESRAAACRKLMAAMRAHPEMVAGTARPCTLIMQAVPDIMVKTGAEGVYAAALPRHGLGLALKVEDGAGRASSVALMAILEQLGAIDAEVLDRLRTVARPVLTNHAGTEVGHIAPAPTWPVTSV